MWIMSNNGMNFFNSEYITDITVKASSKNNNWSICAGMVTGTLPVIASYHSEEQASIALGRIFYALDEGENTFVMPDPHEVDHGTQSRTSCTSMKHSHGGS